MKTTRHSLLAKGLMVLLSLLVLVFAFSFSWFSPPEKTVSASGISLSTSSAGDFDYAVGFKTSETHMNYYVTDWQSSQESTINLTSLKVGQNSYSLLYDFSPKDVTGNGAKLFLPVLIYDSDDTNGKRKIDTTASGYTEVTPNKEYLTFDLIFKSKSPTSISLSDNSFLRASCETTVGDGSLTNTSVANFNKSSYGDFSKDAVVGAMRVAFVEYNTGTGTSGLNSDNIYEDSVDYLKTSPRLLWLPRPDIYLKDAAHEVSGWSLITGVPAPADPAASTITFKPQGSNQFVTVDNTYVHTYYDLGVSGTNTTKQYSGTVSDLSSATSTSFVNLNIPSADNNDDGLPDEYYGKVRVNIWVEGTDAEARRAIAGGKFSFHFDLKAG